ncbi:MAG: phytanoyl-CoA dioxygenase family protein [Pseudomonadota bacterium]
MLEFERDGAELFVSVVGADVLALLRDEFSSLNLKAGGRSFDLSPIVLALLSPSGGIGRVAAGLSGGKGRPVRVLAFDKTPQNNWHLGWHQDRVIAVKERKHTSWDGTWTSKAGIPHVEAPVDVLRALFSLRLHLDDCPAENGALKVVPGSWSAGRLTDAEVRDIAGNRPFATCDADAGDLLAMKALTVHGSDAATEPTHRRVLHVDYCSCSLPDGLDWALDLIPDST